MKTQCALKILNRLLSQFPTILNVARFLQKQLKALVDEYQPKGNEKSSKLWTLAHGCFNNLDKKCQTLDRTNTQGIVTDGAASG